VPAFGGRGRRHRKRPKKKLKSEVRICDGGKVDPNPRWREGKRERNSAICTCLAAQRAREGVQDHQGRRSLQDPRKEGKEAKPIKKVRGFAAARAEERRGAAIHFSFERVGTSVRPRENVMRQGCKAHWLEACSEGRHRHRLHSARESEKAGTTSTP